jgi:tetratricopeptide (TPR) repeat protein
MSTVDLQLTPSAAGWQAAWSCDGHSIDPRIPLDSAAVRTLRGLAPRFLALFEQPGRPFQDPADLRLLGRALFDPVFAPAWPAVQAMLGAGPHLLRLRCAEPDLLNLPWELVELLPDLPLGCDPAWGLLRVPVEMPAPAPDPGPLRLLFLAAAPTDQAQLDFEQEEDAMLRATGRLGQEVVVLPFAETGGIDELAALVVEHRPHVVHLSGHGIVDAQGGGRFAFEDERGLTDSQPVEEIVARVFRGSAVRCVMLNACQTSQAAAAGLAQKLVQAGVPLVLGWAASVADDRATEFATALYGFLARGDSVPAAAARARQDIWRRGRKRHGSHELVDPTFALPQLYTGSAAVELVDRAAPLRPYKGPRTVRTLIDGEIKGLREGFIGRRRIQQRLVSALRDGKVTFAVLHGLGGMGKSTLATRAADRLLEEGFTVHGVRAAPGATPAKAGRATLDKLLEALGRAFLFAQRPDLNDLLSSDKLPLGQRVRLAVQGLRQVRAALVLDNFEDVLDLTTRQIIDPDLREAYEILARDLVDGSRVLVTCRYLPAETPVDRPTVCHEDLAELSEAEFLKFLRRDPKVDARLSNGELTRALVGNLYRLLGGTPGFLEQVRKVLQTADPDNLADDPLGEELPLEEKRQRYYERLFLPQLYAALPPAGQQLASRLAVSELPLPPDALAGLLGSDEEAALTAAEVGVAYGLLQAFREDGLPTLYHSPGLVRPWLVARERLSPDQRRLADGFLARFWEKSYWNKRGRALRVATDVELMVCRTHAQLADEGELFCSASVDLAWLLERRSEWRQARILLEEVVDKDRDHRWWYCLASIDLHEGKYAAAREKLGKALAMREEFARALAQKHGIRDRRGIAKIWHQLATIDIEEGSYAAAREKFVRVLAITQKIRDRAGEAGAWQQLGFIDAEERNFAAAREKCGKALAIARPIRDYAVVTGALHLLASIDLDEGSYAAAREKFGKVLAIAQAIGNRASEAHTWHQLASIDEEEGSYAAAREKFGRALAIEQAIGDRAGEAGAWGQLGKMDVDEGSYAAAREKLGQALAIEQAIGDRAGEAVAWHNLASIDAKEGNYSVAGAKFGKVLALRQAIGDRAGEADTFHQLGFVAWETGQREAAMQLVAIALVINQAIGHRNAQTARKYLLHMCSELGYEQDREEELLRSVSEVYGRDRGRQLLLDALPELKDTFPD